MSEDIKKLKAKEYQARYYQKNKEKCAEMVKKWKAENPDKVKDIIKTTYQNSRIRKDPDKLSNYEMNCIKFKEKYRTDKEYRERYLEGQRAYRSTEEYKLKKQKYNQTEKNKANQKKHSELRKAARAIAAKEREELKALLAPIEVKEPKLIKELKQPKATKPAKPKTPKKPKLVIAPRSKETIIKSIIVTASTKPQSTKEIWLKKQNELRDKIRSKDKNHIDLKNVNKDPYSGMLLPKSIKVKV
jgi:hypothetical protein